MVIDPVSNCTISQSMRFHSRQKQPAILRQSAKNKVQVPATGLGYRHGSPVSCVSDGCSLAIGINNLAYTLARPKWLPDDRAAVGQTKRAVGVLAGWHRRIRDGYRVFAIVIPDVPVWIFHLTLTSEPRIFMPPSGP